MRYSTNAIRLGSIFALAMIGEYVGRIFMESKRRPLYLIRAIYPPTTSVDTGPSG